MDGSLPSTSAAGDGSEPAESIYLQGIKRALHVGQLLQDIANALQQKRERLAEAQRKIEEREQNELYDKNLDVEECIPYKFKNEDSRRSWIKDVFVEQEEEEDSDADSDDEVTEFDYRQMLKLHKRKKKFATEMKSDASLARYMYYSSDFMLGDDKWPSHYKNLKSRKKKKPKVKVEKSAGSPSTMLPDSTDMVKKEDVDGDFSSDSMPTAHFFSLMQRSASGSNVQSQQKKKKQPSMDIIRKRHWRFIAKKEVPKAFRVKTQLRSINVGLVRRLSRECMKKQRAATASSIKLSKDKAGRARRITREMQLFWKKYSKVEKVHRKKAEKHALEQIRLDEEIREAKRQQRKLNFLISQTELFAHFISKKLSKQQDSGEIDERMKAILNNLENDYKTEKENVVNVSTDQHVDTNAEYHDGSYYCDKAMKNVKRALDVQKTQTAAFDGSANSNFSDSYSLVNPSISANDEIEQPSLFKGLLKSYQLKGMNWLINLYEQGINGILADEMGLGKTVQTISFFGHLAERNNIWGPFLVVAPASTLNNWHQEFSRFFPEFKVLPYWGNTQDRRVLRKFWNQKASYHSDRDSAPFHVLVTSYQLVIADVRYFQRIKWQYMVLDEAQALKSSSSVRWKILLDFNCRNRLLLTGTPIQNSMAELWALLHFIMPSLFDSHEEFNEWFSKDIENHIENKSNMDETQLSRLHMILKPFMLRRIKRDVENELSEKIEVRVHCSLTPRQKVLYNAIKQNIRIEDLLRSAGSTSVSSSSGTALMNLVMQFRKVCNHPDLFERREVVMPHRFAQLPSFLIPRLIYREGILSRTTPGKRKLLYCDLNIHHPSNIHSTNRIGLGDGANWNGTFSFLKMLNLDVSTYCKAMTRGMIWRLLASVVIQKTVLTQYFKQVFHGGYSVESGTVGDIQTAGMHKQTGSVAQGKAHNHYNNSKICNYAVNMTSLYSMFCPKSPFLCLFFKRNDDKVYTHHSEYICLKDGEANREQSISHVANLPELFTLEMPTMLRSLYFPKVTSSPPEIYCCDRNACNELYTTPESVVTFLAKQDEFNQSGVGSKNSLFSTLDIPSPPSGWSDIYIPAKEHLVTDSGKMYALDVLLKRLKQEGHRVLIYSQMTRMIDLLEEYMWHRRHTYIRLDGSSRISERRDMVADFQARSDIFAFLLSTRAGGLGINLTAADTVIFYDSDWNPTVDQQAMDRAHRLGQTKQVTVYRLVCQGTVDERILQRAEEKNAIQRMVISGGSFRPDALKPKEVVSLLLDDEQLMQRLKMRKEENRGEGLPYKGKKRGRKTNAEREAKRLKQLQEQGITDPSEHITIAHTTTSSRASSPGQSANSNSRGSASLDLDIESVKSINSAPVSPSSEISGSSDLRIVEDDLIVVDDIVAPVPTPNTRGVSGRGRISGRGRGRPRIRPLMPEAQKRPHPKSTSGRGRANRRNARRGRRIFTGRAAAMAGARAGAAAASAAAYAAYGYGLEPTTGMLSQKEKPVSNTNSIT